MLCLVFAGCSATSSQLGSGENKMRASWYGGNAHGGPTASGERYNMYQMTAAHKTLPMGTILEVRNPANGASVTVRINDRGPYIRGRDLDLSYAAAKKLNMMREGVITVYVKHRGSPKAEVRNQQSKTSPEDRRG